MADVQLPSPRQPGDRLDVEVVERMTGVEPHAERANGLAGAPDALELRRHRRALLVASLRMEGVGIRSGMDFGHRRADAAGRLQLPHFGGDVHPYNDPGFVQARDG